MSIPELARLAVIRAVVAKRLRQGVAKRLRQRVAKRLRQGVAAQGRPVAFYPDKYRVLRVNQPGYPGKCPNPGHGLRSKDDISILG